MLAPADVQINGIRPWDIQVHNEELYSRVFSQGSLGLGEAYMDGWWDSEKLDEFFNRILSAHLDKQIKPLNFFLNAVKAKLINRQSKKLSQVVAKQHYDLGNEFYEKVLDKRMLYTCAYWKNAHNLDQAQENKLELICKKIQLKKGETVLDLGCGWGSFAKYAAEKYGAHVTAVNISKEQVKYARESCKNLPVTVIESDYRETTGSFDKVVAIGICEHIGQKNYKTFMKVVHRCLKDHGLFLLHTIGANKPQAVNDLWLDKYIFPNSILPSIRELSIAFEDLFIMEDWHNFGTDYDTTLMAWHENFNKNWQSLKASFDERFYRMWNYYLLTCAATFRSRSTQLWQVVLSKGGLTGGYESIR